MLKSVPTKKEEIFQILNFIKFEINAETKI